MRFLSTLARIPGGRRTKWLTLLVWLGIGVFAFSFGSQLFGVEKNNADAYLPHTAESTQVLDYYMNLPGHPVLSSPAVVVYVRDGGITPADQALASADVARYQQQVPGLGGPVSGPVPSPNGKALAVSIPLQMPDNVDLGPAINAISNVSQASASAGLRAYIGGPAALNYDANKAFNGLDTTLLFSAGVVVIIVLLLTYRSPFLWLFPVVSAVFALQLAQGIMYLLVRHTGVVVSGQSGGILTVLVFGVGTDYALLLVARYREELHNLADKHEAMAVALRRTGPAIIASGLTVMLATLGLLVSQLASNVGLGKIGAIGVGCALLAMLTLLPALLTVMPRGVFWPAVPRYGTQPHARVGIWARVASAVGRRPRPVWIGATLVLAILAIGLVNLHLGGLTNAESFVSAPSSVKAEQVRTDHYPQTGGDPVTVLADPAGRAAVTSVLQRDQGIVAPPGGVVGQQLGARVFFQVPMADEADSSAAAATVQRLRTELHAVPGANALVGGTTAIQLDIQASARHDRNWVIPIVLAIAFIILIALLRAVVAPVVLIASVVASFLAALGFSVFVFQTFFGQHHEDNSYPLFVFIFLVALGIDYNIFLMTRVREETVRVGTRPGIVRAVAVTGGVITSAGFVLAATFAVLTTLPLTAFLQIGFAVAFGVLLDTMLVRSVLVPALCYDIGRPIWWPSRLAHREPPEPAMATPNPGG